MRKMFHAVTSWLSGLMRRFLNRTPANSYEQIVFDSIRSAAFTFGGRALT